MAKGSQRSIVKEPVQKDRHQKVLIFFYFFSGYFIYGLFGVTSSVCVNWWLGKHSNQCCSLWLYWTIEGRYHDKNIQKSILPYLSRQLRKMLLSVVLSFLLVDLGLPSFIYNIKNPLCDLALLASLSSSDIFSLIHCWLSWPSWVPWLLQPPHLEFVSFFWNSLQYLHKYWSLSLY